MTIDNHHEKFTNHLGLLYPSSVTLRDFLIKEIAPDFFKAIHSNKFQVKYFRIKKILPT